MNIVGELLVSVSFPSRPRDLAPVFPMNATSTVFLLRTIHEVFRWGQLSKFEHCANPLDRIALRDSAYSKRG